MSIWSNLSQIMPGKILKFHIYEDEDFHEQEIYIKIESVNKLPVWGNCKNLIFVSTSHSTVYGKKQDDSFSSVVFDSEDKKIRFGDLVEIDNASIL
jgi:hypothetical protein